MLGVLTHPPRIKRPLISALTSIWDTRRKLWMRSAAALLGAVLAASDVAAIAQTESLLASFTGTTGTTQGTYPSFGNLIQASDGTFYGTTSGGGINGDGTVFKITPSGTFTLLHSFSNATTDGMFPQAGLVQGTDGNFYGTTYDGGANSLGTVFKITSSGTFTLLHSFSSEAMDGANPLAGLVQSTDGNFYGTTSQGGANSCGSVDLCGTVFKIAPSGTFTLLHTFSNTTTDGMNPIAGLVQGTDGNFYGTTLNGGADFSAPALCFLSE